MRPERIIVLLFCAVLALLAVLFLFLPQSPFSIQEKRALQERPKFNFSKLFSGKFTQEIESWFADQFPLRNAFVTVKSLAGISLGQKQNNGILLGAGGQLARWTLKSATEAEVDRIDEPHLQTACKGIRKAAENAECPIVFLFPSRNLDVARSSFDYPENTGLLLNQILRDELSNSVNYIDIEPVLREKYERGEPVIFRTDHHWTALGAYYAYCEVMARFGMESDILPQEEFTKETVTGGFSGTYRSSGGMPWVAKEPLVIWRGKDDGDYLVTADGRKLDGFYTISAQGENGYEVFLDGTHDVITIEKPGETRPKLAIFKDSFANSLAPFLARHFDLVLFNLSSSRQDFTNITKTAKECGANAVLTVYSVYNLLTTDTASRFQ